MMKFASLVGAGLAAATLIFPAPAVATGGGHAAGPGHSQAAAGSAGPSNIKNQDPSDPATFMYDRFLDAAGSVQR